MQEIRVDNYKALVAKLAVRHHAGPAYRTLLAAGFDALAAIREGLRNESADVRHHCCLVLDHFVTQEAMDDLVALLDDPDARVRCSALHALACDRCKEGSCGPEEAKVLPRAIALLATDPDTHVRAHAIGLVGRWVHTNAGAETALLRAMKYDPSPAVRKKAGWLVPGGPIYRKTTPKVRKVKGKRLSEGLKGCPSPERT
jgi:HEAT repeat protein